jgi:hypothetical protein
MNRALIIVTWLLIFLLGFGFWIGVAWLVIQLWRLT